MVMNGSMTTSKAPVPDDRSVVILDWRSAAGILITSIVAPVAAWNAAIWASTPLPSSASLVATRIVLPAKLWAVRRPGPGWAEPVRVSAVPATAVAAVAPTNWRRERLP